MVRTRRSEVAIILFDGFDALATALFTAALAQAGRRWNHRAFELRFCAEREGPVRGESTTVVADTEFAALNTCDVVFVPGGIAILQRLDDEAWASQVAGALKGSPVVCATTEGQFLLAAVDALDGCTPCLDRERATTLHRSTPAMTADTGSETRFSERRLFGASPYSAWKLGIEVVRRTLGRGEADAVARQLGFVAQGLQLTVKD